MPLCRIQRAPGFNGGCAARMVSVEEWQAAVAQRFGDAVAWWHITRPLFLLRFSCRAFVKSCLRASSGGQRELGLGKAEASFGHLPFKLST